ncbi:hypothetical protein [Roseateles sp. P5_E7]
MSSLCRTLSRAAASAVFIFTAPPALATWGPVIEGEPFWDYDSPDAPTGFNIVSTGIYDPTTNLVGYVNWQGDTSDTIHFYIGHPGSAGYVLRQFRTTFWTFPSLGSGEQGLHLLLRAASPSSPPLFSVDLLADSFGGGSLTDNTLRLNSGELYALTVSTIGSSNSGAMASYSLGFSVTDPVPEPPSSALLLPGSMMLALAVRHRRRAHDMGRPTLGGVL